MIYEARNNISQYKNTCFENKSSCVNLKKRLIKL